MQGETADKIVTVGRKLQQLLNDEGHASKRHFLLSQTDFLCD